MASLGGARQRSVLTILLLHANEVIPSDRLVDLVWDGSAPPTAATALQGYVSQLRKAIEPDRAQPTVIVTEGRGYVARVAPDQLDVSRFEQLTRQGRDHLASGRPQQAADAFADALALWRGPPLANVRNEAFAQEPSAASRSCASPRPRITSRRGSRSANTASWSLSSRRWSPSIRCASACAAS